MDSLTIIRFTCRGIRETGHLQQMIFFLREILQRFQDLTIFIMRKEF